MLTWSTSATATSKPNLFQNGRSKAAEQFLTSWDNAVYDGKRLEDPSLNKEAVLWREKFPHLRIIGVSCNGDKRTKKLMSQSKSANTFRENPREVSLPRIDNFRKQ